MARSEIFGPVLFVTVVDSIEDAVKGCSQSAVGDPFKSPKVLMPSLIANLRLPTTFSPETARRWLTVRSPPFRLPFLMSLQFEPIRGAVISCRTTISCKRPLSFSYDRLLARTGLCLPVWGLPSVISNSLGVSRVPLKASPPNTQSCVIRRHAERQIRFRRVCYVRAGATIPTMYALYAIPMHSLSSSTQNGEASENPLPALHCTPVRGPCAPSTLTAAAHCAGVKDKARCLSLTMPEITYARPGTASGAP